MFKRAFNGLAIVYTPITIHVILTITAIVLVIGGCNSSSQPWLSNKLNDTGITYIETTVPASGQDASTGRDANPETISNLDGQKGFHFIKLDASGKALHDQSSTAFTCVKDTVTGLIWETKTRKGLHNGTDAFTWFTSDHTTSGGHRGVKRQTLEQASQTIKKPKNCKRPINDNHNVMQCEFKNDTCFAYIAEEPASYCNTEAFVKRVNAGAGLCGLHNWRLPNSQELRSIVNMANDKPALDADYFPNMHSKEYRSNYWTSTSYVAKRKNASVITQHLSEVLSARVINMNNGVDGHMGKYGRGRIVLVSDGD